MALIEVTLLLPDIRAWIVIPYLLLAPGLALVPLLRLQDVLLEAALVPAIGIVSITFTAMAMVWSGIWNGVVGVLPAVLLTVIGVLAQERAAAVHRANGLERRAGYR
jgi:hypothetical protein